MTIEAPPVEPIQFVNFFLILWIMFVQVLQIHEREESIYWFIPMFTFIIHSFIFYAALIIQRYGLAQLDIKYTEWSAWLRWNGYIAIAANETIRWFLKSRIYKYLLKRFVARLRKNSDAKL